jgi:hypothetical protein
LSVAGALCRPTRHNIAGYIFPTFD